MLEVSTMNPQNTSSLMQFTSNRTLSENIRILREIVTEMKRKKEDKDMIYCGTVECDPQVAEMMRNSFRTFKDEEINEKINKTMEVKVEKEATFVIDLDEIEEKNEENQPKIRECLVILRDITTEISNGKFKHLKIVKAKSKTHLEVFRQNILKQIGCFKKYRQIF